MKPSLIFNIGKPDYRELARYGGEFQLYPSDLDLREMSYTSHPKSIIHSVVREVGIWREFPIIEGIGRTVEFAEMIGTKNILFHLPSNESEYRYFKEGLEIVDLLDYDIHFEIPRVDGISKREVLSMIKTVVKKGYKFVPDSAHLHANGFTFEEVKNLLRKYEKSIEYIHLNGNASRVGEKDNHCPVFSRFNTIEWIYDFTELISKSGKTVVYEGNTDADKYKQICIPYEISTYEKWGDFAARYGFEISPYSPMFSY